MKVSFRTFRSSGFTDLQPEPTAQEAAAFASSLDRESLIGFTHVMDGHIHVITVWFRESGDSSG